MRNARAQVSSIHQESKILRNTLLDNGSLPVEDLAAIAEREGRRPRPIYQSHRWFARRFGSVYRAILTAAVLSEGDNFWNAYYEGVDWSGCVVLDPFVGGGTSIIEALRLGANVIGVDVDAVACAITNFETKLGGMPNIEPALVTLKEKVGNDLAKFYQTITLDGEAKEVLHYFWVQIVECGACGLNVEAHPRFQLAYEAEGTKQWVFCPRCHRIQELDVKETELYCDYCSLTVQIQEGWVSYGTLTCPDCGVKERLIDVAQRTGESPNWRLFALETLEPPLRKRLPMKQRVFRPASKHDHDLFNLAERTLDNRRKVTGNIPWIPERFIPREQRADDRIIKYGYHQYKELFNARQLLHLSLLAENINELEEPYREAAVIAFSNHLTTNCMFTQYAFGWRRLSPLFSVRSFRHVSRPVEINPWIDGTGRGTYPNAFNQVKNAIRAAHFPKEPLVKGGYISVKDHDSFILRPSESAKILHMNSETLRGIDKNSVDFVLTDPPYFDNISYSELSDFFLPWFIEFRLISSKPESYIGFQENIAANGRDNRAIMKYQKSLENCFINVAHVLKPEGRLVFTYQHKTVGAWHALALALKNAGFSAVQLFPLLGDSKSGIHKQRDTSTWDAVFVLRNNGLACKNKLNLEDLFLTQKLLNKSLKHFNIWKNRLTRSENIGFKDADCINFYRACVLLSSLDKFATNEAGKGKSLLNWLQEDTYNQLEKIQCPI